jgi:AAA+ superfamily predicted ATPase
MKTERRTMPWEEANQRVLMAELAWVREALRRHSGRGPAAGYGPEADSPQRHERQGGFTKEESSSCSLGVLRAFVVNSSAGGSPAERARTQPPEHRTGSMAAAEADLDKDRAALPGGPALDQVCAIFGLSPFERATLLLCAGVELDAAVAAECAAAQGDSQRAYPTFSLALAALPEPHWSALAPGAPLRLWRLIEAPTGPLITTSPLRIDERILHFLAGVPGIDERLAGYVDPLPLADDVVPTHQALAGRIVSLWSRPGAAALPVIQLCGRDAAGKRDVASWACASLGLDLHVLPADRLPQAAAELEMLQRLWEREAALGGRALLLDCGNDPAGDGGRDRAVRHWIERSRGPLLVATAEPVPGVLRSRVNLDVRKPTPGEQRRLWERALGTVASELDGQLDRLTSQFHLGATAIRAACAGLAPEDGRAGPTGFPAVWDACRSQARIRLDELAQRIDSRVTWDDLVLPERTMAPLREIAVHVRRRTRVYEEWGFAAKSSRGLGVGAMFAGPSGTGKTLAAEVLANELRLDLYRIDLSQVVSKYIGETEKNLRRVFDAAEDGGAVLLFDEADALFGRRSEVKDSHDRYANIEVSYLLQRMEEYRGLAILTTNRKDALDPAFLRRIRFVVPFPFPDAALRERIWRCIFPPATPTEELDAHRLSRLNVAGGNIRNMALNAAFLAAESGEPVRMRHLSIAARSEFAKLEKPLPDTELEGWE